MKLMKEKMLHELVVARKVAYYVSFWFVGRPNSQEEVPRND